MAADTIFALSSGAGRAAVAVVRITGPASGAVLRVLGGRLPRPRLATLATLVEPRSGEPLDKALVLWFPAPRSFTGEDVAELHLHGGRAVVAALLRALAAFDELRPAEPGEFTRRAFMAGKMDLAAVEGLADLIDAETEAQRRQAQRRADGALGRWIDGLRERLIGLLALAEGSIDFAEDDDIVAVFRREAAAHLVEVRRLVADQLERAGRSEKVRQGLAVAIVGAPNVGKSTLLNALAGREAAIVSVHAGTTRDPVEVDLELGGFAVRLIDTAGLRETDDPVEREGIARARARAASADLVLWLHDDAADPGDPPPARSALWRIATKADIAHGRRDADFSISARSGFGMDGLVDAMTRHAEDLTGGGEEALVSGLRAERALSAALATIDRLTEIAAQGDVEIIAEELRGAIVLLAAVIGDAGAEDVLDRIFARFCIGK